MDINEAKKAVMERCRVVYKGAEYIPNGIIIGYDWSKNKWMNSFDLIPVNGSSSRAQVLIRDCFISGDGGAV